MSLEDIKGIGVKTLQYLKEANINNVTDLIFCFPKSYDFYEVENSLVFSGQQVCIEGILDSKPVFIKYKKNVSAIIFYIIVSNIKIKCIYFSCDYLRYKLFKGMEIIVSGKFKKENKEFFVQDIFFDKFSLKIEVDYKLKNINNSTMQKIIANAVEAMGRFDDYLPVELITKYRLLEINQLISASHFPKSKNDYIQMLRRRKYEEFFWYGISIELLKNLRQSSIKAPRVISDKVKDDFIDILPFSLTVDQQKTIDVVMKDIMSPHPMNRLVQGDVGCGKSVVCYFAAYLSVKCGYQACIMVPTEILCKQQFENLKRLLKPFNFKIEMLTSSIKNKEKEDILYRLVNNRVDIIIGTHALIEENVLFNNLGIVIIDEQHRFGVEQRSKLVSKFKGVDCLYLTATPIPRTLGLTSFGDLDISSIHTMPNDRMVVETKVLKFSFLPQLCKIIDNHLMNMEKVYIVVPLVYENPDFNAVDINRCYEYFSSHLQNAKISIVHGKMKPNEKNEAMLGFKGSKYNVLISTTVIEVGVDVSEATVMVILNAERYGLAQIHQLRGRVGRSNKKSYCYLISDSDIERLTILEQTHDGFEISLKDFNLRGPGDFFGNEQSGFLGLNYANFQDDFKIWQCAKSDSEIYCQKFLKENSKNPKFLKLLALNKLQKNKSN